MRAPPATPVGRVIMVVVQSVVSIHKGAKNKQIAKDVKLGILESYLKVTGLREDSLRKQYLCMCCIQMDFWI